jgi:hypothetical protein
MPTLAKAAPASRGHAGQGWGCWPAPTDQKHALLVGARLPWPHPLDGSRAAVARAGYRASSVR